MSTSPSTPPGHPLGDDEASPPLSSPSSETHTEENPEREPILSSPEQNPASTDPHETVGDDNSNTDKDSSDTSTTDVPLMDWVAFEAAYKKALTEANEVEDQLVLEFEKLSKVGRSNQFQTLSNTSKAFVFWAEASAQHDNDRAWKRCAHSILRQRLSLIFLD